MKIIRNERLIERNRKLGNWISLAALVILGIGMYLSITKPELFSYSVICLVLGFMLTQIGMYMGSRWGRSPRPDEKLDAGMKGLHSEFHLYHYTSPVPHLLVGPAGVWAIIPYNQRGKVEFRNNRWRLSGGGLLQGYLRIFGQEGLGRPDLEASSEIEAVEKHLSKRLDGMKLPEVKALLVFTNDQVEIESGDSPVPAMRLKKIKEFLRSESRSRVLSTAEIDRIAATLPGGD